MRSDHPTAGAQHDVFPSSFAGAGSLSGSRPLAVIIEPMADLAWVVKEALVEMGYEAVVATTHLGAARLSESRCPQLLVACVPAHAQDAVGSYLAECRDMLGMLPTVLMLSDAQADLTGAPCYASRLLKPFTRGELLLAVDHALVLAEHSLAS
jgi:DNA-binding response OmpR family regulator